jgi:hypothetical protein
MRSTAVPCEFEDGRAIETSSTFNLVDISSGKHVRKRGKRVCTEQNLTLKILIAQSF